MRLTEVSVSMGECHAEQILLEEAPNGLIQKMINTFHDQEKVPKAQLQLQLKAIKGGAEAAKLLMEVESHLRTTVCDTVASQLLSDDCVRIGRSDQPRTAKKTSIDFITAKMAKVMGVNRPAFCFRLDIRRTNTIELKLFFDKARQHSEAGPLPWPQEHLLKWPDLDAWCGTVFKDWNLGQFVSNGRVGKKMAVITFGGKPQAIVRQLPQSSDVEQVQNWLAKVIHFVDLRMDELLVAAATT